MKKEKKIATILITIIIIGLIILTFFIKDKEENTTNVLSNNAETIITNAQKESKSVKENEKKDFIQINVEDYLEHYSNTETSLVLVARPTCSYCQIAEPILQNIMYEEKITIYYLNTDNFDEEAKDKFINSDESLKNGFGTPMLYLLGNNSIIDTVDGLTDKAHYIEFLKRNDIIS